MNTPEPSKFRRHFLFLKRLSISIVIISIITMLQFYWSMGKLSDHMSSGCMDCSFFEDGIFMSILTGVFLSVIFSILFFIKNSSLKAFTQFLLLVLIWMFWNYCIFVDRESSWSTYDFEAEIHYTVSLSSIPVLVLGSAAIFLLHLTNKNFRS